MTNTRLGRWVMLGCVGLAFGACESTSELGSTCKAGVCPQAITPGGEMCSAVLAAASIEYTLAPRSELDWAPSEICMPEAAPPSADGLVDCKVYWEIPQPPEDFALEGWPNPLDCDDAPFLSPAEGEEANVCEMTQLTTEQRTAGEEGWYYDGEPGDECNDGLVRVVFTTDARPTNGTRIKVRCLKALRESDDASIDDVPIARCATPPDGDSRGVGDACMPRLIPETGFDPREVVVELGSPDCSTGMCLLRGGLRSDPLPACTSDAGVPCTDVANNVFCTCRCDAPEGQPDACECPTGFECQPLFDDAPDGIRGGYCFPEEG